MMSNHSVEVIGLLPAGGQASRLSPIPMSKELYPIGFYPSGADGGLRPKVVCHYLLEKMRLAGISKAFIVLRPGKWDIPAYLGDGSWLDMHIAYLTVHVPFGVPYTLNQAYPFIQNAMIALGFPDILFQPKDAFVRLRARQASSNADVVLGLFPTDTYRKVGMVDFDQQGVVRQIIEKPQQTELRYMWAIALWTPAFTEFMHQSLMLSLESANSPIPSKELPIGDVIQAAIDRGMHVEAELFPDGSYIDVGTPEDLIKAVRQFTPPFDDGILGV
jgi:glucose-1-phosphate thymidylyltransferase